MLRVCPIAVLQALKAQLEAVQEAKRLLDIARAKKEGIDQTVEKYAGDQLELHKAQGAKEALEAWEIKQEKAAAAAKEADNKAREQVLRELTMSGVLGGGGLMRAGGLFGGGMMGGGMFGGGTGFPQLMAPSPGQPGEGVPNVVEGQLLAPSPGQPGANNKQSRKPILRNDNQN